MFASPASASSPGSGSVEIARLLARLAALTRIEPVPLDHWRDEILTEYQDRKKSTRLRMSQAVREIVDLAGEGATTVDLTPDLVTKYTRSKKGGAPETINGLLSSLRAASRIGERKGWLASGQLDDARWRVAGDGKRRKGRHHPRADVARVLDALRRDSEGWEGGRLYTLACVWAYCGLRRNEALRLRVEDVDLAQGFLYVKPNGEDLKTEGSAAPVPIPKVLRPILSGWLGRCGSEWVFPGVRRLGPWTGGGSGKRAGDRLAAAGRAVGVEGFTPHTLRHSLATHLRLSWRLTPKQVQAVLRHSDEFTQEGYIHPDLADLAELVEDFDYAAPARRKKKGAAHAHVLPQKRFARRRRSA